MSESVVTIECETEGMSCNQCGIKVQDEDPGYALTVADWVLRVSTGPNSGCFVIRLCDEHLRAYMDAFNEAFNERGG